MNFKTPGLIFLFIGSLYAQKSTSPLFIEHHSVIRDSFQIEFISYKVPYNKLVFTKQNDEYKAGASISFEIFKGDEFVEREFQSFDVFTANYEETNSGNNFYDGLIHFEIAPGSYQLKANFNLASLNKPFVPIVSKLPVDTLLVSKLQDPFIIESSNKPGTVFNLANYGNKIPFSPKKYDVIVGFLDTNITGIAISITQLGEVLFTDSIAYFTKGNINLSKAGNRIELSIDTLSTAANIFRITNFSNLLLEGAAELKIEYADTSKKYPLSVIWIDKPKVLTNPEYAIKLLSYIEDKSTITDLLRSKEEYYFKNLFNYWIEHYPADGMKYNFAMNEYYQRADYAIDNFSTLANFDGAETDRGRIYIIYGKPSSIDRNYSEKNDVIEVWNYDKIAKSFVFKDINGTGKFDLVE